MNVYLFVTDAQTFDLRNGKTETFVPFNLIRAETRGKAKVFFCKEHRLAWTYPMQTKLIAKNVYGEAGFVCTGHPLWDKVKHLEK